jgi:hypothetical protein
MKLQNSQDVLNALLAATSNEAVTEIRREIGDPGNAELDQPFGPFSFSWHAFGDNPSNISSIGLGTKPGRSLTERLTNAADAILEDRASANVPTPASARAAALQWFGRPMTGPEDGLFNWHFADHNYDRRILVALHPSGIELAPTIDVLDDGIGIRPSEFPGTILSLQSGNKIKKWYLIGAFGQGGASALAFCDYALIVSRHRDDPKVVGFTLIRVLNLNETYKEDTYGYLCLKDSAGHIAVPSCQVGEGPIEILKPRNGLKQHALSKGTLIRHFSYKLPDLAGSLAPSPGNLYHYLHCTMFDPLFPFRLIDLRNPDRVRDELVTGSRNRLMKLVSKSPKEKEEEDGAGSEIRHHRPMEYFVPHGAQEASIGIEYWVVFNYRKSAKKGEIILRAQSNELYVQTGHPILGTLNGQNQGELTAQMLREAGLGMVARHIVIHIDSTTANSRVRRELFSTNREGFKEGTVLTDLTQVIRKMLEEDKELANIERELTEKIVRREAQATSQEVKQQVTRLLIEAGFQVTAEGPSDTAGEGDERPVRPQRPGKHVVFDPLPTLAFPQVTKFSLVVPRPKLEIRLNDIETVLAETDADAEFDRRGLIAIRTEPDCLELVAKAPLKGGRIRWRLKSRTAAKLGDSGMVLATLTKLDGSQLTDSIDFEIFPAHEEKVKTSKGQVPPFDIIAINPDDDAQAWAMVWPVLSENASPEQQSTVAYKPVRIGGGITVYYSSVFAPFKEHVDKLKLQSPTLMELFRTNYEIWIGYHAILQESSRTGTNAPIDENVLDRLFEEDRTRVARVQVKEASRMAELMRTTIENQKNLATQE